MFASSHTGLIGFDLGATSVKAAQIVRKNGEYRLRAAAIVPRRQRWTAGELADDKPQSSADELTAAASICDRLAGRAAAAMFPMAMCDVLHLAAPAGKRAGMADLRRAVEAETNRPANDRVIDYWPVNVQTGKINVVAASRRWSDQISADVAGGGWHCRMIDALPWALARAVAIVQGGSAPPTAAALDWGYGKATLMLIHQGRPALVRCFKDCGFNNVVTAVERGLRLDQADAESLLLKQGRAPTGGSSTAAWTAVQDVLEEPLHQMVHEVRRTLNYWHVNAGGVSPAVIYLFGGGALLAGVDRQLSEQLAIDVQVWTLPLENTRDAETLPPACLLGPAIGLSAAAWEAL